MPNTGERHEIKRYADAKESQAVQATNKLMVKTKQRPARSVLPKAPAAKVLTDDQAANQMVDEGNPNTKTIPPKP